MNQAKAVDNYTNNCLVNKSVLETNLGIYRCDGIDFHSKITALIHSQRSGKPVEWWFHNETFEQYPWHIEPSESLDQLNDQRARELREKYDYIAISYSGGADSNNVVQSFVRQGLHIDEIVTNHMTYATKKTLILDPKVKYSWNYNAEHQLQAVPRLNELKLMLPKTKFSVLEVSDLVLQGLKSFEDVEWVFDRTEHLSVGQLFRYNYFHFADLKKKFDKGQKVAIVTGIDKPKCLIDKDKNFYVSFLDGPANICSINEFNKDYSNVRIELFYWAKTTAKMVAKQAHTVRRWLELNPRLAPIWFTTSFKSMRLIQERLLRNVVYTTWNQDWFQTDKSTNMVYTEFDTWFHKEPEFKKQQDQWLRGINYLKSIIPDYMHGTQNRVNGLQSFRHNYCCGKILI